jgi:predicted RNase H-like HicB family nuclease
MSDVHTLHDEPRIDAKIKTAAADERPSSDHVPDLVRKRIGDDTMSRKTLTVGAVLIILKLSHAIFKLAVWDDKDQVPAENIHYARVPGWPSIYGGGNTRAEALQTLQKDIDYHLVERAQKNQCVFYVARHTLQRCVLLATRI